MLLQSIDLYEACILNQDVWNVNVLYGNFRFQPYLNLIHIGKNRVLLSCFRVSAQTLKLVKWNKQGAVTLNERKCRTCLNCLELITWMSLNK